MQKHRRAFWIVGSLLWMAVIFTLSSIPDLRSDLPNVWDLIFRKIAHATEFGILTFLYTKSFAPSRRSHILLVAFLSILYAVTDEIHQSFVPGRVGAWTDVLIDTSGVGIFFLLTLWKKKR